MAPGKMIMLEIGGHPVTVVVDREQLEDDLAASGYPADRSVYVTTWSDHQIDDTPTGRTVAARRTRWPPRRATSAMTESR